MIDTCYEESVGEMIFALVVNVFVMLCSRKALLLSNRRENRLFSVVMVGERRLITGYSDNISIRNEKK